VELYDAVLNLLHPYTFLAMSFGVAWGIICGALPGLGATIGIALLIPFTFGMSPIIALPMLAGVYAGAIYGGGITAVLLGVPGTSADAATVFDGHPLAQKGLANKGLTASVSASAFGGMFSALVLLFLAPPLARASLAFGPPEYFLVAVFGLTIIAALCR
jgi:putative tricarboxylic transport membrane protein